MLARSKEKMNVLLVTDDVFGEKNQSSIREFIGDIIAAERNRDTLSLHARKTRYNIQKGDYILKDKTGKVKIVNEYEFDFNYELIGGH